MRMRYLFISLSMVVALNAGAQSIELGNIGEIAKSDPLIITGVVGTQNTYHHTSLGDGYASPMSNTFYANLDINLYGINMPFLLYYSNDNTQFTYPHITFQLNPHYKNWTGHVGQSSMLFSEYVMGMSFNGVGVEYDDKNHWRFGSFYGTLRKAINDDPTDPRARTPQYKRIGWGFKAGYGSGGNYIDIYLLRAYDRLKSLSDYWQERLSPQENIVVGLKGAVAPTRFLSLNVNAAASVFSTDIRAQEVHTEETDQWANVFQARYSSLARFAGDVSANLSLSGISASVYYRMVQPDYISLGTYYLSNNYQSLGLNFSTTLLKGVSLSANFSGQQDNLSNKQLYTTRGLIYSLIASTRLGGLNLALAYNGYTQKQYDGAAIVNDTTRVDRRTQSVSFTPSYGIDGDVLSHTIALSTSFTENKDLNTFSNHTGDITSTAIGLSYNMGIKPWETNITASLNHQLSKGENTQYSSDIAALTASRNFFDDALTLSATLSMCYNEIKHQSKSLSVAGDLQAGYTLKKAHTFSLSASMSKYGDVNPTKTRSSLDITDISISLNYAYTFSLLELRRKGSGDTEKKGKM